MNLTPKVFANFQDSHQKKQAKKQKTSPLNIDFPMRVKHKILSGLTAVAMLCAATGCVCEEAVTDCPDSSKTPSSFMLNLDLTVPASADAMSRAGGHEFEPGTDPENFIHLSYPGGEDGLHPDYKVFIFDKDGGFVGDVDDLGESVSSKYMGMGSNGANYRLTFNLSLDRAQKERMSQFQIMVLANYMSFQEKNKPCQSYPSFAEVRNLDGLYVDDENFNFEFSDVSDTKHWQPVVGTVEESSGIPMFGLSQKINIADAIAMSEADDYEPISIPMLRALAKVEIVDDTSEGITNVGRLPMKFLSGRLIPNLKENPDWDGPDIQIVKSSLASDGGIHYNVSAGSSDIPLFRKQNGEITVWYMYLPEIEIPFRGKDDSGSRAFGIGGGLDDQDGLYFRPAFSFTFNGKQYGFELDNNIDMKSIGTARYAKGDGTLTDILRNHIYRYTVTGSTAGLTVKMDVLPWDLVTEEEWHFDPPTVKLPENFNPEEPTYPYHLKWTVMKEDPDNPGEMEPNGYTDDDYNMYLFMKPGVDSYAECRFTLAAPLNATWYATLIPLQGDYSAFEFEEGYDHGKIDGTTPAVVRFKNTEEIVSNERNEARLVIEVEYPDKTRREAIVVKPGSNSNNYIVVQQKTTID